MSLYEILVLGDATDLALLSLPCVVIALLAKAKLNWTKRLGSERRVANGMTGSEVAEALVPGLTIERVSGALADHFDPAGRVLRLSDDVADGRSLYAIGVSAHEAGHAIQQREGSRVLIGHNLIVSAASIGSGVFWLVFLAGAWLKVPRLLDHAVNLLAVNFAVQIVHLPVELDATRRARKALESLGLVDPADASILRAVMDAAPFDAYRPRVAQPPPALVLGWLRRATGKGKT